MKHYFLGLFCLLFSLTACKGNSDYLSSDLQTFDLKGDVLCVVNECMLVDQQTDKSYSLYSQTIFFDKEKHTFQSMHFVTGSKHSMVPCSPKTFYDFDLLEGKNCTRTIDKEHRLRNVEIGDNTFTWFHSNSGDLDSIRVKMDFGERMIRFGNGTESYEMYGMSGLSTLDRTFSEVEYDDHGNWTSRKSVNTINEVEYGIMDETWHYCFSEYRYFIYGSDSDTCSVNTFNADSRSYSSHNHHFTCNNGKGYFDNNPVRIEITDDNKIQLWSQGKGGDSFRGGIIVPFFEGQLYCYDGYFVGTTKDGEMIIMKNDSDLDDSDYYEDEDDADIDEYEDDDIFQYSEHYEYDGMIDNSLPVTIMLERMDTDLIGEYYYNKYGPNNKLRLSGNLVGNDYRDFEMEEFNAKETKIGVFKGRFAEDYSTMNGTYTLLSKNKTMPFTARFKSENTASSISSNDRSHQDNYQVGHSSLDRFKPRAGATYDGSKPSSINVSATNSVSLTFNQDDTFTILFMDFNYHSRNVYKYKLTPHGDGYDIEFVSDGFPCVFYFDTKRGRINVGNDGDPFWIKGPSY